MPLPALIALALGSAALADEQPITVQGYPWAPFISPMGEPFRGGAANEAPIARWFGKADRDRDGMLTADEMLEDADRFFKRLDSNQDGRIDPDEIRTYEWEIAPEIQVNSEWRRTRAQATAESRLGPEESPDEEPRKRTDQHDGYRIDGLQGAARYGLLNIPQPVASADADFNRVITLAEFRQAASNRFKLLEGDRPGRIALAELEARLPIRPKGRRAKPRKNAPDSRIGLPLPEGD